MEENEAVNGESTSVISIQWMPLYVHVDGVACMCVSKGSSLSVCISVKCHCLTVADTGEVSFVAVAPMWHRTIAILFTHRPTPSHQCACVSADVHTTAFPLLWNEEERNRWKKPKIYIYPVFHMLPAVTESPNTLCSFSEASHIPSCTQGHTGAFGRESELQETTKMWWWTRSSWQPQGLTTYVSHIP